MHRKRGVWIFYEGRWIPYFAGGAPDGDDGSNNSNSDNGNSDNGGSDPDKTGEGNSINSDEYKQKYEQTLKFLQEKFGVSSIDELALKLKAEEEQKLKEQQKYKELAEKKEKEALEYRQKYQQTILRAEVVGKASQMGFIDPEVVLSLVSPKAVVKEDGSIEVEGKAIDQFLKELAEAKPYLVKASGKQGSGATTTQGKNEPEIKTFEDLLNAGSQAMKEFMEKYPERYQKLKDEYFAKKVGG